MVDLLKEGTKHLTGVEEAVLKNVDAVKKLSQITRTSLGPNGMNKMVVNHLEKLYVTSDAATILNELEVQHPAAKMVVLAAQQQEAEVGDATNLVVVLAGELMANAEGLLRMGLHPSLIVEGYSRAGKEAIKILDSLPAAAGAESKAVDPRDAAAVARALRSTIASKQYGFDDVLAPLVAKACIASLPHNAPVKEFNVDNVRVAKILGGSIADSSVVRGFVVPRDTEGTIKHLTNARIAVYVGGIDLPKTETKGTVLVQNAKELLEYSASEEAMMEKVVREIAEAGVSVVISGSSICDLAMHYLEKYKIMVVKILSKFDIRRLCNAVGATPQLQLGAPALDKLGKCDVVTVEEIGSTKCTVFRQEKEGEGELATIVVRSSTQNLLDDLGRAIDDGVNVFKALCRDGKFVAGAGAAEMEIAIRLARFGESQPGLDQYAIKKYAEAFEVVPRTLAENAGLPPSQVVSDLYAAHSAGKVNAGVDVEGGNHGICDAAQLAILDHAANKRSAIEFATNAVVTVLRVDQIIMQKPAGGPKPPNQGGSGAMDSNDPDFK